MPQILDDRIRVQIEIALARGEVCPASLASQEQQARAAGLSGAEIDAARGRRCFDVRAAAAVHVACALREAGEIQPPLAATARRAGLSQAELADIATLALANPKS